MNIILTGASSGIGYSTILSLKNTGNHKIFAVSRSLEKLEILKSEFYSEFSDSDLHIFPFDLSSGDYSDLLSEAEIFFQFGESSKLDVLINNAGLLKNKDFFQTTSDDWQDILNVNLLAPVTLITLFENYFNPIHSHILNISSMGGIQGSVKFPGLSAYSTSKGAIVTLTECLANEFQDRNIFVNCIAPGAVDTDMLTLAFPGFKAKVSANDMGDFIAKFAVNNSNIINGKVIQVSLNN